MPLIYTLVSRGMNVLCEYTAPGHSGNFSSITRVLLKKIPTENDSGLTYLAMSDRELSRITAFQYLQSVQQQFLHSYGNRWQTAIAFAFQADFQRTIQLLMDKYNSAPAGDDKISRIQSDLTAVKDVMVLNIEKVLERGEKIELLVEKTEILDAHAFKFKKGATQLKNRMWWKNIKWLVILAIVLALVIYIILAIACKGPKLPSCS